MSDHIETFQREVWRYYREHGRHDLPWRLPEPDGSLDPYKILVSEIMLQQTQVSRVIPKYHAFLAQFPTVNELATAPMAQVLKLWNGLGYNRRAKFLWEAAQAIVRDHHGVFPPDVKALDMLPGVGVNTAGAIRAYAFNLPAIFIETNIRTVYIHHFFADQLAVSDTDLATLVEGTLDRQNAREWYWALMDYGTFLKQSVGNKNRASKSYTKQSAFAGSNRQLRGAIIRALFEQPQSLDSLQRAVADDRLPDTMAQLVKEGLVRTEGGHFSIS